ncbi:MAG: hypothetical protein DMG08_25550 [Acidobacteria bacterium]|nr:MAG: hypothetical protein DMG08_25550 [Acidobacteriota bacterium]
MKRQAFRSALTPGGRCGHRSAKDTRSRQCRHCYGSWSSCGSCGSWSCGGSCGSWSSCGCGDCHCGHSRQSRHSRCRHRMVVLRRRARCAARASPVRDSDVSFAFTSFLFGI